MAQATSMSDKEEQVINLSEEDSGFFENLDDDPFGPEDSSLIDPFADDREIPQTLDGPIDLETTDQEWDPLQNTEELQNDAPLEDLDLDQLEASSEPSTPEQDPLNGLFDDPLDPASEQQEEHSGDRVDEDSSFDLETESLQHAREELELAEAPAKAPSPADEMDLALDAEQVESMLTDPLDDEDETVEDIFNGPLDDQDELQEPLPADPFAEADSKFAALFEEQTEELAETVAITPPASEPEPPTEELEETPPGAAESAALTAAAAATASAALASRATEPAPDPSTTDHNAPTTAPKGDRGLPLAALLAGALGLGTAGFATWHAMQNQQQLAALSATQEAQAAAASSSSGEKNSERLEIVEGRLDNMLGALESITESMQQNSSAPMDNGQLAAMQARLDRMETGVADLASKLHRLDQSLGAMQDQLKEVKDAPPARPVVATPAKSPAQPQAAAAVKPNDPSGGDWAVNLLSVHKESLADREIKRLARLGLPVEKIQAQKGSQTWYRVRVIGFPNYGEAKKYQAVMKKDYDLKDAWVGKTR
jgi:chemotaxis protein histidine kinase CheA